MKRNEYKDRKGINPPCLRSLFARERGFLPNFYSFPFLTFVDVVVVVRIAWRLAQSPLTTNRFL